MRPTVPEMLDGLQRLLTQEIAPYIDSPHARDLVTANIATNLERIKRQWHELAGYMQWDNQEIERLLADARAPVEVRDAALEARIGEVLAGGEGEALLTPDALADRNAELRDVLAAVIRCLAGPSNPPVIDAIRSHLREALRRYP